jgi:hypothetical protein
LHILSTDDGIQIEESLEQPENAQRPIRDNLELDSKVIEARDVQTRQQFRQSLSRDEGKQMDKSDEQWEKAERPRRDSLESDSKVTEERDEHA